MKRLLILFLLATLTGPIIGYADSKGKVIAAYGLPGCGKSSVFNELNKITETEFLGEPEVENWPEYTTNSELMDPFTFMMAMRTRRVAELRLADKWRNEGKVVLIEPYYAKVDHLYLGKEHLKWFFGPEDPYFEAGLEIFKKDAELLPDADVVVIFDIDYDTWIQFLNTRNREMDKEEQLRSSYKMVEYIAEAEPYLKNRCVQVIHFKQEFTSPKEQAKKLKSLLIKEKALPNKEI